MPEGSSIKLNPDVYEAPLMRVVDGHVADMKAVLRSLDDGSFLDRAFTPSPGAVLNFTIGHSSEPERDAVQRACAKTFRAIIGEFLCFIDHIIAFNRVILDGSIKIDKPRVSKEELLDLVRKLLDEKYQEVASDRSLNNPTKIDRVFRTNDALKTAKSLVAVRNCLEHRGGVPEADLEFVFRRMELSTGDVEIKAFPHDVVDEKLTFDLRLESRVFAAATRITLSEMDIDNVSLTVRFLAREILEVGEREDRAMRMR